MRGKLPALPHYFVGWVEGEVGMALTPGSCFSVSSVGSGSGVPGSGVPGSGVPASGSGVSTEPGPGSSGIPPPSKFKFSLHNTEI